MLNIFYGCKGLTSITIGNSVASIESWAFGFCIGLNDVYCYAEHIPSTSEYAFKNTSISEATLHVPASVYSVYRSSYPWNNFGRIVALTHDDPKPAGIDIVRGEDLKQNGFYDLQGRKTTSPRNGLYINNGKKMMVK